MIRAGKNNNDKLGDISSLVPNGRGSADNASLLFQNSAILSRKQPFGGGKPLVRHPANRNRPILCNPRRV